VVRDGALFLTLYLLAAAWLFGDDDGGIEIEATGGQEMGGGISVHSYTRASDDD
jgi:hypothetical protein